MIALGSVIAYFVIGAFVGRFAYGRVYRRNGILRDTDASMAGWLALLFWPLSPFALACFGLNRWFHAPIARNTAKIEQLREDARRWDEKRRTGTEAEREMAGELARMCRDRAEEMRP